MSNAVEVSRVTKVYGSGASRVEALRGVNLSVETGELVAMMGPSGSGKTTLLMIAGGLEAPTTGEVTVGGVELSQLSADEAAAIRRTSIGYVFQDFNLLAGLTAVENVSLPLELDGMGMRAAQRVATEVLERFDLADRVHHFPDDLSGGERQRVAISRALIGDRFLLLADEPTGALDSDNGQSAMRILRQVSDEGATCVFVTHDAELAAWADRIVYIRDGLIVDEPSGSIVSSAPTNGNRS